MTGNRTRQAVISSATDLYFAWNMECQLDKGITVNFNHPQPYTVGSRILLEETPDGSFQPATTFLDPQRIKTQLESFLRALPKTELHLHLEGLVNKKTLFKIIRKNKINKKITCMDDIDRLFEFGGNLSGFIDTFLLLQKNLLSTDDYLLLLDDLSTYMRYNNVIYAEIFIAITSPLKNGISYPVLIDALADKSRELEKKTGRIIRYIIDVSRSFGVENAEANLDQVLAHPSDYVVGIGMGGNEKNGRTRDYAPVFARAHKSGLNAVAHAGEDAGPARLDGARSIREAVRDLGAQRIGHGIGAIEDPALIRELAQKKIPIEICVSSNAFTGRYIKKPADHPVKEFQARGIVNTVNSDDPTFFGTDISAEYSLLASELGFTADTLIQLAANGIACSFYKNKSELKKEFLRQVDVLKKKYPLVIC